MFKFFTMFSSLYAVIGVASFILSFYESDFIWLAVSMVNIGFVLFIVGLFASIIKDVEERKKA